MTFIAKIPSGNIGFSAIESSILNLNAVDFMKHEKLEKVHSILFLRFKRRFFSECSTDYFQVIKTV